MSRPSWTTVTPILAGVALVPAWFAHPESAILLSLLAVLLIGAVLAAVHHAEVVAHRVGEPYGSLLLAVAVTIIEVGLIVTLMVTTDKDTAGLARDTVFAAAMITVNGIVGISLLVGALKHHLAVFNPEGTGAALATVIALAVVCLVLPSVTTSQPGPEFTGAQLAFAAIASLTLYGMFVFTQTIRHRDFFLPVTSAQHSPLVADAPAPAGSRGFEHEPVDLDEDGHADPPTDRAAYTSLALLVLSLVAVVGLAKIESPAIESGVAALGFPQRRRRRGDRAARPRSGDHRRGAGRHPQPGAGEPQPRARLGDGLDRPDHPRHRHRLHLARRTARARAQPAPDRAARPDGRGRDPHRRTGSGEAAPGRRAPRAPRRVPVPDHRAVADGPAGNALRPGRSPAGPRERVDQPKYLA